MIKKKIVFALIYVFLSGCSFDDKTGIWSGEKEKRKISQLEQEQKEIIDIYKVYSSEDIFSKEILLSRKIILSNPHKNSSWSMSGLNNQNYLGNIYFPKINLKFLKKKIGKNKFSESNKITSILTFKDNIIFSDDTGTIFYLNEYGKIIWKKNIYKKMYKKIYKNLSLMIYKNNIYIADNIGLIYTINLNSGKIVWIKNYGISIKSVIKIYDNKIFLLDQDNRIISLNIKDASKIWDILSISSFIKSQNLMSIAITKDGDLISLNTSADLIKVHGNSGRIYWSRNTSESLYAADTDFFKSSKIVIKDNEIIFSSNSSIFSFNLINGDLNWQNDASSSGIPIVEKDNIFIVTENGYFLILDRMTGKIISSQNILKVLKKRKRNTKITGFIMGSGKIYSVTLNGYLIISSALSGKVESFRKIGDQISVSPIISNGKLYVITEKSKILILN